MRTQLVDGVKSSEALDKLPIIRPATESTQSRSFLDGEDHDHHRQRSSQIRKTSGGQLVARVYGGTGGDVRRCRD